MIRGHDCVGSEARGSRGGEHGLFIRGLAKLAHALRRLHGSARAEITMAERDVAANGVEGIKWSNLANS